MASASYRCGLCGQMCWTGARHVCPPVQCAHCGQFYPRREQHLCAVVQAQQAQARQAAVYQVDTGKGQCQQCGSRNLQDRWIETESRGASGAQGMACCVGALFFWPMLLVAPFLGRSGRSELFRSCASCGHSWRV